ncbi:MAG: hypothetical protein JWO72_60 [Caulobacteraceae bacterium]|nr:hypothetical protein [Caulobacteraceae bacterium]
MKALALSTVVVAPILLGAAGRSVPAAALPDWSGIWENVSGIHMTQPTRDGRNLAPNPPPMNAESQAKYDAVLAAAKAGRPINDPTANCVWPGTPRIIVAPYPSEFLFTPGRVTIIYEYMSQVRRIRTDGSLHPKDLDVSYNGDSIGHWEGQGPGKTLVVETVGLRPDTMYENTGLPHSPALSMVERIHLAGPDELVDEMTFTDPGALTRPWTAVWHYKRHRDWQMLDYVCEENNRNPNVGGVTGVAR